MIAASRPAKKRGFVSWINKESTAGYIFSLPFIIGFLMANLLGK